MTTVGQMMKLIILSVFVGVLTFQQTRTLSPFAPGPKDSVHLDRILMALHPSLDPRCSVFFFTHTNHTTSRGLKDVITLMSQSTALFETSLEHHDNENNQTNFLSLVIKARELRQSSWCVTTVVVYDDADSLSTFADASLKGRLMVWSTKLIIITNITLQELKPLISTKYTFSNMNVLIITPIRFGLGVYTYLPYTQNGPQFLRVASWSLQKGLQYTSSLNLFPEKYENLHGAKIPVAATTYKPLWVEKQEINKDGQIITQRTGMDYFLLQTVAKAMNFTFDVVPIKYWSEALDLTSERKVLMTPVYHAVLHQRMEFFEYTVGYTYAFISFCMAKPQLVTNWLSLYYPMDNIVWISILATLLIVPAVLTLMQQLSPNKGENDTMSAGNVLQNVLAILLAQSVLQNLPRNTIQRFLLGVWLIGTLVLGLAYRGSLIAFLTLPKYPLRPETIEQLVDTADSMTAMAWGSDFVTYFRNSGSPLFERLADLMVIGVGDLDGLQQALEKNQAYMDTIHKMQQDIAEHFTEEDGSTRLYIGREYLMPALAAWPIPHDAPYRPQLDRHITAVVEAGLYDKWTEDMMELARQESRDRRIQETEETQGIKEQEKELKPTDAIKALSLTQMFGPLLLLGIGLIMAIVFFSLELFLFGRLI